MSKSKKLQLLEKLLRFMASAIIRKYQPRIVGISGSVGKTSAKEAVFLALSTKFDTRKNLKNYNNEIGIPLTIIGAESGGRSVLKWLFVFAKWMGLLILPLKYPEILVLEMGIDRPGDMKKLVEFIPVEVGVLTNISSSHAEFFKDLEHIAKEKGKLIESLPEAGAAILNGDDEMVLGLREKTKAKSLTYGFSEAVQVKATDVAFNNASGKPGGLSLKLNYAGKIIPVRLNHLLAKHQVYAALAAIAVSTHFKINLMDAVTTLEDYVSPPGRANLLKGIKNSFLIDDTYNASPVSVTAALEILAELEARRKIAVLGDMLELGKEEESGHRAVAQKVAGIKTDLFFAIGERMESAIKELRRIGYPADKIFYFEDPVLAGRKLQQEIREGDLVLIKGSQGMRMEKIVEEVMAEPQAAEELLCRQDKKWRNKPFLKP